MLSPDQLATRSGRMSATDVAAASGCNPYRGPLDVYLEKLGLAEPFDGNRRTKFGHKLEPMIREDYEEVHDCTVEVHGTIVHPEIDWACASPDGLVYPRGARYPERGMEIKIHGRAAVIFGNLVYGDEGTDEVPLHELVQSMWGIHCSKLDRWDLIPFLDGAPMEFTIERDDELIAMLAEKAERLLVDHIQKKIPPEPDGSIAWDHWLKRRWEKNTADLIDIDQVPELLALVAELRSHRSSLADLEIATDAIVQRIKNAIGDKAGLIWTDPDHPKAAKLRKPPTSSVTWKRSKDGERDDWKATVAAMRTSAGLVASGRKAEIAAALDVLHGVGPDMIQGANGEMAGSKIFELLEACSVSLEALATYTTHTNIVSGARPFNVPRWWKTTKPDDNRDNTVTEEN